MIIRQGGRIVKMITFILSFLVLGHVDLITTLLLHVIGSIQTPGGGCSLIFIRICLSLVLVTNISHLLIQTWFSSDQSLDVHSNIKESSIASFVPEKEQSDIKVAIFWKVVLWKHDACHSDPTSVDPSWNTMNRFFSSASSVQLSYLPAHLRNGWQLFQRNWRGFLWHWFTKDRVRKYYRLEENPTPPVHHFLPAAEGLTWGTKAFIR